MSQFMALYARRMMRERIAASRALRGKPVRASFTAEALYWRRALHRQTGLYAYTPK